MKSKELDILVAWDRFDGDDCFEDFRITVTPCDSNLQIYEFGPCSVRAVRKMKLFLSDQAQQSIEGGFQNPDIRTYDWQRNGTDLTLAVKFEGSNFEAKHILLSPEITISEEPYSYN